MLRGLPHEREGRGSRVQLMKGGGGGGGGGGGAQPARQTLSTSSSPSRLLTP